jgi:hypothetical protein
MIFTSIIAAALVAQATPAPSAQPTALPSPQATAAHPNNGKHLGQVKKLRAGTLTPAQLRYALTHQSQEAQRLAAMHSVKFENLRVYRAPAGLLHNMHASSQALAYEPFRLDDAVAQSTLGSFLNIIANVNVQDALNGTLNGNTVDLSLSDVLNGNNIAIGQVVGVYVNSGGIITTIIK